MNKIAETTFVGVWPDGKQAPITIQIGHPFQEEGCYCCPVALMGLVGELKGVCGEKSFDALCLAMGLVRRLLLDFQEKGGKLFFEDSESPYSDDEQIDLATMFDLHGPSALGASDGETEYLLRSKANAKRLKNSICDLENP